MAVRAVGFKGKICIASVFPFSAVAVTIDDGHSLAGQQV